MTKEQKNYIEYRELFKNAPFASVIFDLDGNIIEINTEMERLFGYSNGEIIGKNFQDLTTYTDDQQGIVQERYESLLNGEKLSAKEIRCIKKDGTEFFGLSRVSVIRVQGKKYIQGIIYDISEKKETEEKLRQSQEKYKLITENINDFIAILDNKFRYEYINQPITQKLMGYTNNDVYGKSALELIHPEDRVMAAERLKGGFKKGYGSGTIRFLHKEGHWIWFEVRGKTFTGFDGNKKGLIISRDITSRKENQLKLLKLSKMVEQSTDALIRTDRNFKISYVNKAAEELFGYKLEEIKGKTPEIFNAEESSNNKQKKIYDIVSNGKTYIDRFLNKKKNGTLFYCEMRISPLFDEKDNIIGYLGSQKDVTDRKLAKERLLEARNRSDFYKDLLAHDISNILNNIQASTHLLETWNNIYGKTDERMEIIEIIKKQIERGASLISNVHKISETEKIEPSKHSLNVNNIIESATKHIKLRFNEKDINIKKELLQGLTVLGGEFLFDAVENILINAIIHNENKKIQIWIETSEIVEDNQTYVKIEFRDNGIGIIEKRKRSIFERSHRLRKSTIGMGIGLSLVKKIIKAYDGKVWVENRVKGDHSQGSNFIVLLKKK